MYEYFSPLKIEKCIYSYYYKKIDKVHCYFSLVCFFKHIFALKDFCYCFFYKTKLFHVYEYLFPHTVHKLKSVGVGSLVLSVIEEFLTCRSHYVSLVAWCSQSVDEVSGVPQGSVLGQLLFILFTAELVRISENIYVSYADDSTLVAVYIKPADRARVTESLNRDLVRIGDWCSTYGMLLNPSKTKSIHFLRSRTPYPPFLDLRMNDCVVELMDEVLILGVWLDCKLTFEYYLRKVAAAASQKLGILRRAWCIVNDKNTLLQCFRGFVLPLLEYCSPVWRSSARCLLKLLERMGRQASFTLGGELPCNLSHRRNVASLCMFYRLC